MNSQLLRVGWRGWCALHFYWHPDTGLVVDRLLVQAGGGVPHSIRRILLAGLRGQRWTLDCLRHRDRRCCARRIADQFLNLNPGMVVSIREMFSTDTQLNNWDVTADYLSNPIVQLRRRSENGIVRKPVTEMGAITKSRGPCLELFLGQFLVSLLVKTRPPLSAGM